jgi:lipoprotein-anchoring transpeptidase ErfK/SrfK
MHGASSGKPSLKRIWALFAIAVSLLLALGPVSASALSVGAPANVLDKTDVTGSLTASDTPGVALLFVDARLTRSLTATRVPASFVFKGVPLTAGRHKVRLLLRDRGGVRRSPTRDVVSWRKALPPLLLSPKPGSYVGKAAAVVAKAGAWTTSLKLTLNGKVIATKSCVPGQVVSFGTVAFASGTNTLGLVGANPVSSASGTFRVKRLDFPWPTCVVVDKSEYRLYWVKDGALVKIYPVAIGKPSTPTPERNWKVGAKYVYDVWGVYGPRRLRLYKQVGSSFEYTNYGIHGTNEEWVIGTMASHGCIRMYNRDVLELYPQVPVGTWVQTRD